MGFSAVPTFRLPMALRLATQQALCRRRDPLSNKEGERPLAVQPMQTMESEALTNLCATKHLFPASPTSSTISASSCRLTCWTSSKLRDLVTSQGAET